MAKFLVLVKPRPSSPPPTQKKEFLKSGRNRVKSGEIGRNRVKLGSGGHRWALGGRLWAGRGTPHNTTLVCYFFEHICRVVSTKKQQNTKTRILCFVYFGIINGKDPPRKKKRGWKNSTGFFFFFEFSKKTKTKGGREGILPYGAKTWSQTTVTTHHRLTLKKKKKNRDCWFSTKNCTPL